MKTTITVTILLCLAAIVANAASPVQTLNCKMSYVTHTQGSEPQEYIYDVASQMGLVDAATGAAFVTGKTDVATFVAKLNNGLLEMHVKESDTGHEAMSVGPIVGNQASNVYLITDRRYATSEDMTQIQVSCAIKNLQ